MISRLALIWRTAKFLKLGQIFGRLYFRLKLVKVNRSPPPEVSQATTFYNSPAARPSNMIGSRSWVFLNCEGHLDSIGWRDERRSKLWRYNQHYFDDLNASEASRRVAWHQDIIQRWIEDNPPSQGVAWDPYPVSLRIVNWVKWSLLGNEPSQLMTHSLAIQARWLERRLEWHLLGNHLFANAKALVHAGLFFEGPEADEWLSRGMSILKQQVGEQILADGSQFELSPMYHALAVEDLLDLINICSASSSRLTSLHVRQVEQWCEIIPKMLHWLAAVSHPDEEISFFNDAAFGVAPSNPELWAYASRLGFSKPITNAGTTDLAESGMVRLQHGGAVIIADLAAVGPDYLPGHAHADTLAFEMSFEDQRIFVNTGVSEYGLSGERLRQRSTPAHNTVCVAGRNSSEVWAGFRVGNRANIIERYVSKNGKTLHASATHDGYRKELNGLLHTRNFDLDQGSLIIEDVLVGPAKAEARFHLHPTVSLEFERRFGGEILLPNGSNMKWEITGADEVSLINTTWHPKFGVNIPNKCLVAHFNNSKCRFALLWD